MNIQDVFPSLGMGLGKTDGRNPSTTKSGPGRRHKPHHQKGSRRSNANSASMMAMAQAAMMAQMAGSQTDHVTNTPLKSATRGG